MATLIMAGVILGGYGLMLVASLLRRRSGRRVLFTVDDETFGLIQVRRDDWEANPLVEELNRGVKVSAERRAHVPTSEQAALWLEIVKRLDELLAKARLELQKDSDSAAGKDVEFQTKELELTEVRLYPDGGFSFDFEVPRLKGRLPDGFYADYSDFEVVEAGHVH